MALLTIVLGLLLAGGGGYFVFLGFDIVMTDRGAAMTIAGTMALSGGIMTLAIGFAILRLSHILRAIEQAGEQAGRPSPFTAREAQPASAVTADTPAQQQPPVGAIVAGGAMAAGAVGAAVLAAGVTGEPFVETIAADADVAPPADAGELDAWELDAGELDAGKIDAGKIGTPQDTLADVVDQVGSAGEAEALIGEGAADAPEPAVDDSPVGEPAVLPLSTRSMIDDDIFADLDALLQPAAPANAVDAPAASSIGLAEHAGGNGLGVPEDEADLAGDTTEGEPEPVPPTGIDPLADDREQRAAPSLAASPAQRGGEPKMLGSYNAGGRTYTMYSDGSVEAVTENGVERFSSMESLRQHLART